MNKWVERAIEGKVTDVGQLSRGDKRELDKAVKHGQLMKVWDVSYPKPKRAYTARLGYPNIISDLEAL